MPGRFRWKWWSASVALFVVAGCSEEVTGPAPSVADDTPEAQALDPGFTCNEQVSGWVTVTGSEFSPLVVDALDSPATELPTVTLTQTSSVTGEALSEAPFSVTISDEHTVTITDDTGAETQRPAVRWISGETLEFYVHPELALAAGTYDVTVTNPGGEAATVSAAFGAAPRPMTTGLQPDMMCVAQGPRTATVEGTGFLVGPDGQMPTVLVDGVEYSTSVDQADCVAMSEAFDGFMTCTALSIEIGQAEFDAGSYMINVVNPAPAACASLDEDGTELLIVEPPIVAEVTPQPICGAQIDHDQMTVTGENFIRVTDAEGNELLPTVTVGDQTYDATGADGCEEISGLANEAAARCTELTFAIPADDQADQLGDGERFADVTVSVTNPQPAGCTSEQDDVAVTVVPPPTVADVKPDPLCVAEADKTVRITGFGFIDYAGEMPRVQVGQNVYDVDALDQCSDLQTANGDPFRSCDAATITVPSADLGADQIHATAVINPGAAGCITDDPSGLYIVGPPQLNDVSPQPICTTDGDTELTLTGSNFVRVTQDDGAGGTIDRLPTVTVGTQTYVADAATGCADAPLYDDGAQADADLCTGLTVTVPQNAVSAGQYDVSVTNPTDPNDPKDFDAECTSSELQTLTVVPPPTVAAIAEQIACTAEAARSFTITGSDFLTIAGIQPTVVVTDAAGTQHTYDATVTASTCTASTVNNREVETCTELTFTSAAGDLAAGLAQVSVVNPDSAACASSTTLDLTVAAPPTVAGVQPNPVCDDQGDQLVTVTGSDFYVVDGTVPAVTITDANGNQTTYTPTVDAADCTAVTAVTDRTVQNCTAMTISVTAGSLADGAFDVTVDNPAPTDCSVDAQDALVSVGAPSVNAITDDFACNETAAQTFTISGSGFIKTATSLPEVTIGGNLVTTTTASGCTAIAGIPGAESCTDLTIDVGAATLPTGSHDVVVNNASSGGCASSEAVALEIVGIPAIADVSPALFCDQAGGTQLTVTGTNFLVVDGTNPAVTLDGQSFAIDSISGCTTLTGLSASVDRCDTIEVTIPAGQTADTKTLEVLNPAPVDCPSNAQKDLVIAGPPVITSSQPAQVCSNDTSFAGAVTLFGSNILEIDGQQPTATVNGVSATVTGLTGCTDVTNADYAIRECTEISIQVPSGQLDVDMDVLINNPAPANCGSGTPHVITQEPAPVIDNVTPPRLCYTGGTISVTGSDFDPNMTATLGGLQASSVTVNASGTQADITFDIPPSAGLHDLVLTNPNGCAQGASQQVRVLDGPQVFYVDPPVVYNGISTQVTIYLSGLYGGTVTQVNVTDSSGNTTTLTANFDPNKPNTVQAIVPMGILPTGVTSDLYDIEVVDDVNCSGSARDLLTVTDDASIDLVSVDPPFGWKDESTAVTIEAAENPTAPLVNFSPTPRVYLNPANPQPGDVASELRATQYIDATQLNSIVPSGLPVGTYDVIAVNPDGTVGVLASAFDVTELAPPKIDTVVPGSWSNQSTTDITVEGADFRAGATVEVFCQDSNGAQVVPSSITGTTVVNSTTITATVDASNVPHLSVCYLVVTNTDNGTYAEYSPITVFNPAGNFVAFNQGPDMLFPRRDPAMEGAQPSRRAQFIYAIGGDDGTAAGAYDHIEASPIDRFGNPGPWFQLFPRQDLSQYIGPAGDEVGARTLTDTARIGDFVYMAGGQDGSGTALDAVLRANILDPLDVPTITNVEFSFDERAGGNMPGTYYYRVSAVLSDTNPHNPGGETLASEPQALRVPGRSIVVELSWPTFPDAVKYRVYRSESPDQPYGNEELIAEVDPPATGNIVTFLDDGTHTITQDFYALPLGSLGMWHKVGVLNTARFSHGVEAVADPGDTDPTDGTTWYLYAVGGNDGTGLLSSYEYVPITVHGARDQSIGAVTELASNMTAREQLNAVAAGPFNASRLSNTWIIANGGLDATGTSLRTNEVAQVTPGTGVLDLFTAISNNQAVRAGHATVVANNALANAGGATGNSADKANSVLFCDPATVGCTEPDLENWNSLSQVNLRPRYLSGFISFNGFLYMAGGVDPTVTGSPVLQTVDYSVLGGTP